MKTISLIISLVASIAMAEGQQTNSVTCLRLQVWKHPEITSTEKMAVLRELLNPSMTVKEAEALLGPGEKIMFSGSTETQMRGIMYDFPAGKIFIYYDSVTGIIKPLNTK